MEIVKGFEIEAEELGMVALIGLILAPGALWIVKGKTTASKIVRATVVAAFLAGAVAVEASMDRTVDEAV